MRVRNRKSAHTMNKVYYETVDQMQKKKVDPEYINGWASGFLRNPKREEQRVNMDKNTGGFEAWIRK
jgi:hypothetical protein